MDDRWFNELTKLMAQGASRRGTMRMLAGSITASVLAAARSRVVTADQVESDAFGFCRPPGTPCSKDKKCCTGKCRNGSCTCAKRGTPCINRVGVNCCSGTCRDGTCG
jgi:hypothetical protein